MSVEKILLEAAGEINELQLFESRDGFGSISANLDWIRRVDNSQTEKRRRLITIAAEAALAIAEIDAEAERGKRLGQARALLVGAKGYKYLHIFPKDGEINFSDFSARACTWETIEHPTDCAEHVERLARVLQERAEKSG